MNSEISKRVLEIFNDTGSFSVASVAAERPKFEKELVEELRSLEHVDVIDFSEMKQSNEYFGLSKAASDLTSSSLVDIEIWTV